MSIAKIMLSFFIASRSRSWERSEKSELYAIKIENSKNLENKSVVILSVNESTVHFQWSSNDLTITSILDLLMSLIQDIIMKLLWRKRIRCWDV
jgi:hypothetical protein